jgi:hypothetical protein
MSIDNNEKQQITKLISIDSQASDISPLRTNRVASFDRDLRYDRAASHEERNLVQVECHRHNATQGALRVQFAALYTEKSAEREEEKKIERYEIHPLISNEVN